MIDNDNLFIYFAIILYTVYCILYVLYNYYRTIVDSIYIDESGFNLHLTRRKGRAPRGRRPIVVRPTQRGRNLTLMVAIGKEGIIASEVHLGSTNTNKFLEFVENDVLKNLENLGNKTIIMDNARIHKPNCIRQAFEDAGHELIFLPPYTPHLDCAEWVFADVKPFVKKQELKSPDSLEDFIKQGIRRIGPSKSQGWLSKVNRNFLKALKGEPLGQLYND